MRKRRWLQPLPTAHKPPPVLPRRPLTDFSAAEREQLLSKRRGYQAAQAEEDVALRRRYVDKYWKGTALDDDDALLIASFPGAALLTSYPLVQRLMAEWVTALSITFPRSEGARAALERELALQPRWMLDFLAYLERLRNAIETTRVQAGIIMRRLATVERQPAFGTMRADATHELLLYLQSRHPDHIPPPPKIVAIFLWRALWKIDPDDARAVRVLMTEYGSWLRQRGLPNPRGHRKRPRKRP